LALLPLFQDALDLTGTASLPYAPSFVLALRTTLSTNQPIYHVQDFQFLPGFNEPTLALLFTANPTWTGRLDMPNAKDSFGLVILTLDFSGANNHAVILDVPMGLPYNSFKLIAAPRDLGGVIVLSGDILTHVDQSGKMLHLALTGWAGQISNAPLQYATSTLKTFDNAQFLFTSSLSALLFSPAGEVYTVLFARDGRTLTSIQLGASPAALTCSPSTVELVGRNLVYVASALSSSALLRYNAPASASSKGAEIEEDDDDALYAVAPRTPRTPIAETVVELPLLELCDSIAAYGPIRAMTVGLVSEDVRAGCPFEPGLSGYGQVQPELIACTGGMHSGGLTIFSVSRWSCFAVE
jgi:cleavage and polyadenylation specificity factor subunit 1